MRFKGQIITWLPASLLALSVGFVIQGCEDPAEVSEEELRVLDEDEGALLQSEEDGDEDAAPQEDGLDRSAAPEPSAAKGWKKDDDHGGWKKGGWKKDDDHGGWKKGGWKKDDDHGGWKKGGWKKDDDHGGWKKDDDHGGWKKGGWKKDDDHGGGWKKDDDHGGGWKKDDH